MSVRGFSRHRLRAFGHATKRREELPDVQRHEDPHAEGQERQDEERIDRPDLARVR